MDSREFAKTLEKQVADFCETLNTKLPAYSYIPLESDEARIKVMQSRLFNEIRAGEIFGGWLKSTPELDVKKTLAEAVHEEYVHAGYLEEALKAKGAVPYEYKPLPAQMAMFNAFEGLTETVERIAAFPMAGEGVADYLIGKSLNVGTVPSVGHGPVSKNSRRRRRTRQLPIRDSRQVRDDAGEARESGTSRCDEPDASTPVLRQSRPLGVRE